MVQAVSLRFLAAYATVRTRANPCGICGGQSDTETGFSPATSVSPVSIISPVIHTHLYLRCLLPGRHTGEA
jgi:hypothetical protein